MQVIKKLLAAILCSGIAGFSIYSLFVGSGLFSPTGNPTALQKADDPVRNGFRIIEVRALNAPPRVEQTWSDDSTVILLDNWIFTDKGKPSPFN
jgi:hypothetical protein